MAAGRQLGLDPPDAVYLSRMVIYPNISQPDMEKLLGVTDNSGRN